MKLLAIKNPLNNTTIFSHLIEPSATSEWIDNYLMWLLKQFPNSLEIQTEEGQISYYCEEYILEHTNSLSLVTTFDEVVTADFAKCVKTDHEAWLYSLAN